MPVRVKLGAIARNEGAYLADWVFHHLHFGFDAIEVWVNGTEDGSLRILRAISAVRPEVTARVADRLLEECLARGENFQYRAYAKIARRARRDGFTHAAFLDLDEYWLPRDLTARVQDFLPEDPDVNVVSFLWGLDVPEPQAAPFVPPLDGAVRVQLDRHVKSVLRLDDSVQQIRTHTARTRSGTRLLVREPFPLVDERAQQWGSLVPAEQEASWDRLPEAFVLHAMHRSPTEYVAKLADGVRQTGADVPYKTNRHGFLPSGAPVLTVEADARALADYRRARRRFRARVGVEGRVRTAQAKVVARAESLLAEAVEDRAVMERLRVALRGVPAPRLDAAYPGWDTTVHWWVDGTEVRAGRTWVVGWAYAVPPGERPVIALRDGSGRVWGVPEVGVTVRPEVRAERGDAPVDCGFEFAVPAALEPDLGQVEVLVRAQGAPFWDARRLLRTSATTG